MQSVQPQLSPQTFPLAKHSQYSLRHIDFLHVHFTSTFRLELFPTGIFDWSSWPCLKYSELVVFVSSFDCFNSDFIILFLPLLFNCYESILKFEFFLEFIELIGNEMSDLVDRLFLSEYKDDNSFCWGSTKDLLMKLLSESLTLFLVLGLMFSFYCKSFLLLRYCWNSFLSMFKPLSTYFIC